jgi:hypothetical protein
MSELLRKIAELEDKVSKDNTVIKKPKRKRDSDTES